MMPVVADEKGGKERRCRKLYCLTALWWWVVVALVVKERVCQKFKWWWLHGGARV